MGLPTTTLTPPHPAQYPNLYPYSHACLRPLTLLPPATYPQPPTPSLLPEVAALAQEEHRLAEHLGALQARRRIRVRVRKSGQK